LRTFIVGSIAPGHERETLRFLAEPEGLQQRELDGHVQIDARELAVRGARGLTRHVERLVVMIGNGQHAEGTEDPSTDRHPRKVTPPYPLEERGGSEDDR